MLTPPPGLDIEDLRGELVRQFGVSSPDLQFVPVGEDSWSFRTDDLWVSVRRDLRIHLPAAYELPYRLNQLGLDFILAPLPGRDGRIVRTVGAYPVLVFPYVAAQPLSRHGLTGGELDRVRQMLTRVHRASLAAQLPAETYTVAFHAELDAIEKVGSDGMDRCSGPFADRFARLVRAHFGNIRAWRQELADLGERCAASDEPPVLIHGEPCAPNILRRGDQLLLIDWGEAMWGPPERDFFHVVRTLGPVPRQRREFMRFYEIRWRLSEIAEYGERFLAEHAGDADDQAMWERLQWYLPERDENRDSRGPTSPSL